AFGLTVLTMAYAVGHISGGHFNPAVSFGLWASGRFSTKDLLPYIIAQCLGGIVAAGTLLYILSGKAGFAIDNTKAGAFATNGYGAFSPDGYSMAAAFTAEFVLTMFFLIVILGATDKAANGKFAGIAIGFALTLIHLISIPITNTSVNPARSTSQAIFAQGESLSQLWLFWVAPIAGALVGGFIYKILLDKKDTL
ncbi:MAG TPA: aquaporin Z, partial [Flavobacterium sp.]|nr:aquaporin Z [Flavobacterium sp.]